MATFDSRRVNTTGTNLGCSMKRWEENMSIRLQGRVYPSPLSISFHWSSGAVLAAAVCSVLRRRKGKLPRAQGFSYAVNDFATPRRDSGEKQWLISTLHERKMRNTNWKFEVGKRCHALLGLFGKSYWSCSSCFQPRELFPSCKDHLDGKCQVAWGSSGDRGGLRCAELGLVGQHPFEPSLEAEREGEI